MEIQKTDADAYAEFASMPPEMAARCRKNYDRLRQTKGVRDAFIQVLTAELEESGRRLAGLLGKN